MAVKNILLLGNPLLYKLCEEIKEEELPGLQPVIDDLHDTLFDFRKKYKAGRAIAAPQIGFFKRIVYMNIDKPIVFINPVLNNFSDEMFELWDDCMSFPDIFVKVKRHKRCTITFKNMNWENCTMELQDDLSELLQHEVDHLNGILAVSRAIDGKSFMLRSERHYQI
ncbi:MAG: peptide deformylase [Ignavibacteriaceae bacterium]